MSHLDQAREASPIVPYKVDEHVRLPVEVRDALVGFVDRMIYVGSEYECYCETPGTGDCAVCEINVALERLRR